MFDTICRSISRGVSMIARSPWRVYIVYRSHIQRVPITHKIHEMERWTTVISSNTEELSLRSQLAAEYILIRVVFGGCTLFCFVHIGFISKFAPTLICIVRQVSLKSITEDDGGTIYSLSRRKTDPFDSELSFLPIATVVANKLERLRVQSITKHIRLS